MRGGHEGTITELCTVIHSGFSQMENKFGDFLGILRNSCFWAAFLSS